MTPLSKKEKMLLSLPSIEEITPADDHRERARRGVKITVIFLFCFTLAQAGCYLLFGDPTVLNRKVAAISVAINFSMVLVVAAFGLFNFHLVDKFRWNQKTSYYVTIHGTLIASALALLSHIHIAGSSCTLIPVLLVTLSLMAGWLIGYKAAWFYFFLGTAGIGVLFGMEKYELLTFFPLHAMREKVPTEIFLESRYLISNMSFFLINGLFVLALLVFYQKSLSEKNRQLAGALKQLSLLASTDPLTGLLNRRQAILKLEEEMERAKRESKALTVAILDIDNFKKINDTYGHPAGDKVLQGIAKVLTQSFRNYDVIARIGGEEFMIVIPNSGPMRGKDFLARAIKQIADTPFYIKGSLSLSVTISAGCTVFDPASPVAIERLFCRADDALYTSKKRGKDRVTFIDASTTIQSNKDVSPKHIDLKLCENVF